MDYYINIGIKPESEMRESPLMNLVYGKFHKALLKLNTKQIGVSFPGTKLKLGRFIRVHGDKTDLQDFQGLNWLCGAAGYCEINDLRNVPSDTKYRTVSRIRTNMSKSKLERLKRRGSITLDEEKIYKAKMFSQGLDNPYLDLESGSTGQKYRLFIHFGPLLAEPVAGKFDSYGLSKVATVPWF